MRKYLFIGDSHAMFLIANKKSSLVKSFLHLREGRNEAISMHMSSTMFSFEKEIDWIIEASIEDTSHFETVVFIFGTNDVMKKGEGYAPLEECIKKYLFKVNEVAERIKAQRVVVASPIACRNPVDEPSLQGCLDRYWPFEVIKERLLQADTLLELECKNYPNLNFLSMLALLQDKNKDLKANLSSDGIHFNSIGRRMYVDRLDKFVGSLL